VVVCDDDADAVAHARASRGIGMAMRTLVPSPGVLRTKSSAPSFREPGAAA